MAFTTKSALTRRKFLTLASTASAGIALAACAPAATPTAAPAKPAEAAKDFRMSPGADEADAQDDREYLPRGGDCREKAWAQIFRRRGQGPFRDGLLRRYGSQCLVTGCTVLAILEAAHIDPYREDMHNHLGNGLLLRADIHTLFDLDLLVIEPTDLRIILHPDVAEHYNDIVADRLLVSGEQRPLIEALRRRYEQFKKDRDWDK